MSLGTSLAKARKMAGLSLDELSHLTSMRIAVLKDFENDDFSKCGGDTYARGHLRNLGHALHTSTPLLLEMYESEQSIPGRSMHDLLVENSVMHSHKKRKQISGKTLISISATLIVAAAGSQIVYSNIHSSPKKILSAVAVPSQAPQPEPSLAAGTTQTPALNLSIVASRGSTWLFARDDGGTTLFSGRLDQGESKDLSSAGKITVRFGNAGAVDVSVNGEIVGEMGVLGEVVDHIFEANSSN